jgi:hypothetical protein
MIALSRDKSLGCPGLNSLTPRLHEIPNIFERLGAGETVEVNVQVTLGLYYPDYDGWFYTGKDCRNLHLSMWCEKTVNDFKVKAAVQTEETSQHPEDWQVSNLNEKKEKQ